MLEKISEPKDIKALSLNELEALADEMRQALLFRLSKKGGHCGPNFGMVEATIALHYVFDSPKDAFVFDVSHQSYCHKMLTGRQEAFTKEEAFASITGYSNFEESEHDFFKLGHTSTSISLALGMAKARDLQGKKNNVIAIIGDGSLSGGQALEALDYAGEFDGNLIILVNDNDMSIAENHGGLYKSLKALRQSKGTSENNIFTSFGLDYCFIEDGNDLEALITTFQRVKDINHPIVVHMHTQKGKGYAPAEKDKESWHWCKPFDPKTGKSLVAEEEVSYGSLTCDYLMAKMQEDPTVITLVAAVPTNIGFTPDKRKAAGKQFIDVGIAEELGVSMASGLARNGAKPVFATHASFLQRTYDQLSQDLCINSSPATILVNTASVYGMNDVTHLGIFDIPMLSNIPNLVYLAPTSKAEYFAMMDWSLAQEKVPVAIRIPCNGVIEDERQPDIDYACLNRYKVEHEGRDIAILALGDFFQLGQALHQALKEKGIDATLINPRFITGLDCALLEKLKASHTKIVTLEDGILDGGFGQKIASYYGNSTMKVWNYGLEKKFYDCYDVEEVLKEVRCTPQQIMEDILK